MKETDSESTVKIAGVVRESITDGPGIRFTVFAQGCPHRCNGCHNPQTWSFDGGISTNIEKIIEKMKADPLIRGLTLSGGEPFCQASEFAMLAKSAHVAGYDVITYTGYTFEQLMELAENESGIMSLLEQTDILIDGRFEEKSKSYNLRFKGSANQRILDVKKSLILKKAVEAQI